MILESIISVSTGILGIGGLGYQLFKMITTKKTRAISYNLSILVGFSISLWVFYGIEKNDPVIFVPNIILVGILAGMALYKYCSERMIPLEGLRWLAHEYKN